MFPVRRGSMGKLRGGKGIDERGVGYTADMLVFALLLSFASLFLLKASPVDPRDESTRYASSFAQSTLLALQHSTAGEFGGFEYQLGAVGFEPVISDSAKRNLKHKTLAQLLVEDAFLNLRVGVGGTEAALFKPSQDMSGKLREFLKNALDGLVGGRFGYRLTAKTAPLDLGYARARFETEIKNLDGGAQQKLCSETVTAILPIPRAELARRIRETLGADELGLEPDPVVEITLELWSS